MQYKCTRNDGPSVSAAQAIARGISEDGGLFVPESLPNYSHAALCEMEHSTYNERAKRILGDFLTDFTPEEISECVDAAYTEEKFPGGMAPLSLLQDGPLSMYLLELWHGPTCAFKDMALQLLPHLLTKSLQKIHADKTAVILVATSGDTGKAALEGFKDVPGTMLQVFYPENGVSPMQKRQMTTQEGGNVAVCAIAGNFDDAQTGVKNIFANPDVTQALEARGMMFSSANSINWGRLLPQIVYYFSAYCDLMKTGEIDREGERVNIVVPTGNFGNILAAYYAMKMGLPVKRLICASNANNVLTEFLATGVYDRNRGFYATCSPSMDILVSSNLERLLYDLTGSSSTVAGWMRELAAMGKYRVDAGTLAKLQAVFSAGFCDDATTKEAIHNLHSTENYLCDTHTAVAVQVYRDYANKTGDYETPAIVVSTASPYKFAGAVLEAVAGGAQGGDEFEQVNMLAALTATEVPEPLLALQGKAERFDETCAADGMAAVVLRLLQ